LYLSQLVTGIPETRDLGINRRAALRPPHLIAEQRAVIPDERGRLPRRRLERSGLDGTRVGLLVGPLVHAQTSSFLHSDQWGFAYLRL
jgi:hypothetical protein